MIHDDDDELSGVFDPAVDVELSPDERARVIAGRYEIVERIGEGAMGQVLRVRHLRLGKSFALKLMKAEFALEPESRQIFHREARLASALSHPNIVSIVDFGEDPDWGLFIVMEFLEGELLAARIRDHQDWDGAPARGLPVAVVCDVASQLVDAVRHSHESNVIHGDIKAENVLCVQQPGEERRAWSVKLLDYGMARLVTDPSRPHERIAGTPEYMAPERITGGPPQPSNDIYALGVLMYEMLAGSVPFSADDPTEILHSQLREDPQPVSQRRGDELDDKLVAIVGRAMARSPADRYPDAATLLGDLRAYMEELGMRRRAALRRPTTEPGGDRRRAAATAFDGLGVPAAGLFTDGTVVVANRAFARLLGSSGPGELEGQSILDTRMAELHRGLREDLRMAAMDGKIIRRRVSLLLKSGRELTLRILMTPADESCGHCLLVLHPIPTPPG